MSTSTSKKKYHLVIDTLKPEMEPKLEEFVKSLRKFINLHSIYNAVIFNDDMFVPAYKLVGSKSNGREEE